MSVPGGIPCCRSCVEPRWFLEAAAAACFDWFCCCCSSISAAISCKLVSGSYRGNQCSEPSLSMDPAFKDTLPKIEKFSSLLYLISYYARIATVNNSFFPLSSANPPNPTRKKFKVRRDSLLVEEKRMSTGKRFCLTWAHPGFCWLHLISTSGTSFYCRLPIFTSYCNELSRLYCLNFFKSNANYIILSSTTFVPF